MISFDLTLKSKNFFFDRERVIRAADRAQRAVLSKCGAFVRRAAKSSIRPRRRPANPGEPPSSHTGLLRRFIYFAWDPQRRSVVVGPALLKPRSTAPWALEHGGLTVPTGRRWQRARGQMIRIHPHPYMLPAAEREAPRFLGLWRGSVRAA